MHPNHSYKTPRQEPRGELDNLQAVARAGGTGAVVSLAASAATHWPRGGGARTLGHSHYMAGMNLTERPDGVIEHDGMLWKPRSLTASAEEFIAARTLFAELNKDARWNPWIRDERKPDIDRAIEIMSQWQRAERGHRHLTLKQWEAQQTQCERQQEQQRAEDDVRRGRDQGRYDADRAVARLHLIEVQSRLDYEVAELAGFREGMKFPAMDPTRRVEAIEELRKKVDRLRAEVEHLEPIVGDPEDVVDEHGWLPRDRREHTWWTYRLDRERKVRDLKQQVPKLEAALKATIDPAERREHRDRLGEETRRLKQLIAEGPYTVDEMCSECATPMAHHGWTWPPRSPCPAWPEWAARIREARQILERFEKRPDEAAPPPSKVKSQPLAVVPSGLPIADVVAKLTELQQQYPNAEVRRGRANRWELWGPDQE